LVVFLIFFVFVPCGRLNWLTIFGRTYRIVFCYYDYNRSDYCSMHWSRKELYLQDASSILFMVVNHNDCIFKNVNVTCTGESRYTL